MGDWLPLYFFKYRHILGISLDDIKSRPCKAVKNLSPNTEFWYLFIFNNKDIYRNPDVNKVLTYPVEDSRPDYQQNT